MLRLVCSVRFEMCNLVKPTRNQSQLLATSGEEKQNASYYAGRSSHRHGGQRDCFLDGILRGSLLSVPKDGGMFPGLWPPFEWVRINKTGQHDTVRFVGDILQFGSQQEIDRQELFVRESLKPRRAS